MLSPEQRLAHAPTLPFDPRLGLATAQRTYLRKKTRDTYESVDEMAARVAAGNVLIPLSENVRKHAHNVLKRCIKEVTRGERDVLEALLETADGELIRSFLERFDAIRTGGMLTSGRHLQHGDLTIADRTIETSTNCSTSALSNTKLMLLLNGSGVGRLYDDDIMIVDWRKQPELLLALSPSHPDYGQSIDGSPWDERFVTDDEAAERADTALAAGREVVYYTVPDNREGWAHAAQLFENLTYEGKQDALLVLDFSNVREKGAPIRGMQNRPASGPVPLMAGLLKITALREHDPEPWEASMIVDHEMAAIVAVGGVRRAARIAVKFWADPGIFRFIEFKRCIEHRTGSGHVYYWSSNNSVGVDEEFWFGVEKARRILHRHNLNLSDFASRIVLGYTNGTKIVPAGTVLENEEEWDPLYGASYQLLDEDEEMYRRLGLDALGERELLAANVFIAASACAFYDQTGEPGFINVDRLANIKDGLEDLINNLIEDPDQVIRLDSKDVSYRLTDTSRQMVVDLARIALTKKYPFLTNPCGEIVLLFLGGYCTIGSIAPANRVRHYEVIGQDPEEDVEADLKHLARVQTRFLMNVNLLPCLYRGEVKRTNRIGVGVCDLHTFYMAQYGIGFRDVVSEGVFKYLLSTTSGDDLTEDEWKAVAFWQLVGRISQEVRAEANRYADTLGVTRPHTSTMIAPNGTTAKLYNICEGAHLPGLLAYLRNVLFSTTAKAKEIAEYEAAGYPVYKTQRTYLGSTIVGFPTKPFIVELAQRLGLEDKLVTAAEATAAEQYRWIQLLERFWIQGDGKHPGNQVSYSLKFDPAKLTYLDFCDYMADYQSQVRCTSVIVQEESSTPDPFGIVEKVTGTKPGSSPFEYLPEQPVPLEVLNFLEERLARRADGTYLQEDIGREHVECEGGACPITFRD